MAEHTGGYVSLRGSEAIQSSPLLLQGGKEGGSLCHPALDAGPSLLPPGIRGDLSAYGGIKGGD